MRAVLDVHIVMHIVTGFDFEFHEGAEIKVLNWTASSHVSAPHGHVHVERLIRFVLAVLDAEHLAFTQFHTRHVGVDAVFGASLKQKTCDSSLVLVAMVCWVSGPVL